MSKQVNIATSLTKQGVRMMAKRQVKKAVGNTLAASLLTTLINHFIKKVK